MFAEEEMEGRGGEDFNRKGPARKCKQVRVYECMARAKKVMRLVSERGSGEGARRVGAQHSWMDNGCARFRDTRPRRLRPTSLKTLIPIACTFLAVQKYLWSAAPAMNLCARFVYKKDRNCEIAVTCFQGRCGSACAATQHDAGGTARGAPPRPPVARPSLSKNAHAIRPPLPPKISPKFSLYILFISHSLNFFIYSVSTAAGPTAFAQMHHTPPTIIHPYFGKRDPATTSSYLSHFFFINFILFPSHLTNYTHTDTHALPPREATTYVYLVPTLFFFSSSPHET